MAVAQLPLAGRYTDRIVGSGTMWDTPSGPGVIVAQPESDVTGHGLSYAFSPWAQVAFSDRSNRLTQAMVRRLCTQASGGDQVVVLTVEPTIIPFEPEWGKPALDCGKLIGEIRSVLSLQVKELASILHVERPTVYAWLKGHSSPQRANRERLHWLFRIAKLWENLCRVPVGGHIRQAMPDGASVADLLCRHDVAETEIQNRFRAMAQAINAERRSRIASVRELAARSGVRLQHVPDQQGELDVLTGKRVGAD